MKIAFDCDYMTGACPEVMDAVTNVGNEFHVGYGEDEYSFRAEEKIKTACDAPDARVYFVSGGTQVNRTFIGATLRPHHGVISADSGHIAVHESGAIESTGHKVLALKSGQGEQAGKITAQQVEDALLDHENEPTHEHMVKPAMLYISQPTEFGTVYSIEELKKLRQVTSKHNVLVYVDGARLAYAMAYIKHDSGEDLLPALAKYCDAFSIGGTKCGALFGEALVVTNKQLQDDFRYIIKQSGAMFAKGFLIGAQFDALFTNELYYKIGEYGVDMAMKLSKCFTDYGFELAAESPTNQQFPILPEKFADILSKKFGFSIWEKVPGGKVITRFVTSFSTKQEYLDQLNKALSEEF